MTIETVGLNPGEFGHWARQMTGQEHGHEWAKLTERARENFVVAELFYWRVNAQTPGYLVETLWLS